MQGLDYFFNPRSVALIGASSRPGKIGYEVLKNLTTGGYRGKVYPINPKEEKILGLQCYKEISDVPDDIDLAVLSLPAKIVPGIVEVCGKKGVKAVVIISGGFRELGGRGAEFESKMVENAKKYGVRVIGPNCIGVFDGKTHIDTFFQPREVMLRPPPGKISFLTQSGTYGVSMLEWLAEESVGISKFISYGNKSDIGEIDCLKYLGDDPDTAVIGIYMEGLRKNEGKEFLHIAREVGRKKPIVIIKAGATKEGARAAGSHTGAMAGDDRIFAGAFEQSGIIVVDDLEEMLDVMKLFAMQPLPKGGAIGMTTNGAGPCIVAIDFLSKYPNLTLAKLSKNGLTRLKLKLPPFCVFSNPLDLTGSADAIMYEKALEFLGEEKEVDILMPFFVYQDAPLAATANETRVVMVKSSRYGKTILGCASGADYTRRESFALQKNGIPMIPTPRRAISALAKVLQYAEWKKRNT